MLSKPSIVVHRFSQGERENWCRFEIKQRPNGATYLLVCWQIQNNIFPFLYVWNIALLDSSLVRIGK